MCFNVYGWSLQHCLSHYVHIYVKDHQTQNEKETLEKLVNTKSTLKNFLDDTELFDNRWLAENIWSNKKYPSVKNLITLYNRLGIPNIFKVLASVGHKDYKTPLNSFLSIRESIAHQGAGDVTYKDVKSYIDFINNLIYMFDKELYKHCCRVAGGVFWPR